MSSRNHHTWAILAICAAAIVMFYWMAMRITAQDVKPLSPDTPVFEPGSQIRVSLRSGRSLIPSVDGLIFVDRQDDIWLHIRYETHGKVTQRCHVRISEIEYYWVEEGKK